MRNNIRINQWMPPPPAPENMPFNAPIGQPSHLSKLISRILEHFIIISPYFEVLTNSHPRMPSHTNPNNNSINNNSGLLPTPTVNNFAMNKNIYNGNNNNNLTSTPLTPIRMFIKLRAFVYLFVNSILF